MLFFTLVYFLSIVPLQVYFALAALLICGLLLFGSRKIYQMQLKKKKNIDTKWHIWHVPAQVQAQQKREHLTCARTLGDMLAFSPSEFEEFVGLLLGLSGYRDVRHVGKSGDLGADLLACDAWGNLIIIQCKKYSQGKNIGTPDLQRFVGAIVRYKARKGIFVTTSSFTKQALDYVKDKPIIQLMDGESLTNLAHSVAMVQ
jgi:restriction endonuclease Mrr